MSNVETTLYVTGVPQGVTQSQLQSTVNGAVKEVREVKFNERKKFAHVVFESREAAEKGLKILKKTPISGTVLEFEWAKNREQPEFDEASNKTVFIQNLSTSTEAEEVQTAFAEYGEVERAFIVTDKKTKASKGQAVVEFKDRESAEKALELNDTELGGQTITVEFAKAPRSSKSNQRGGKPSNGSSRPGQKRKANDDNGDNGTDSDKPAKKQKASTTPAAKKSDSTAAKKETPKKETAAAPKKETPKKAEAAAAPKKETPKKEAASPKKETPKKAATPSKAKGKK